MFEHSNSCCSRCDTIEPQVDQECKQSFTLSTFRSRETPRMDYDLRCELLFQRYITYTDLTKQRSLVGTCLFDSVSRCCSQPCSQSQGSDHRSGKPIPSLCYLALASSLTLPNSISCKMHSIVALSPKSEKR
jgi:hypothetical protein